MDLPVGFVERFRSAESVDDVISAAKEYDIDISSGLAENIYRSLHSDGVLEDSDLDNVSGGCFADTPGLDIDTDDPHCPSCSGKLEYVSVHLEIGTTQYRCVKCGRDYFLSGGKWSG